MMYGGGSYGSAPYGGSVASAAAAVVGYVIKKGITILKTVFNLTILRGQSHDRHTLRTKSNDKHILK